MNHVTDRLRCHFGLTLAEARLTLHLVTGETLRCAAVKLSISYETARTSLKNIFRKTGTCRQAELVMVVLTALPECLEALAPELQRRFDPPCTRLELGPCHVAKRPRQPPTCAHMEIAQLATGIAQATR